MTGSTTFRLHFLVFLWGFTGVIGKLISIEALPLVWYRLVIALVVIAIYMGVKNIRFQELRKNRIQLLLIGSLIGLHWYLFFLAIKVSNVSIALCTLSTGALFSALLEPIFFKRKVDFFEILISVIVIVCMAVIFKIEPGYSYGIMIGIVCTLFSVLFSILNTQFIREHKGSPTRYSFYELIGALLLISLLLFFDGNLKSLGNIGAMDLMWLFILGAVLTAYPMIESMDLLKKISPYTMLLTINLEPVYGIIIAYFVFPDSEQMNTQFYLVVLILVTSIILNRYLKDKFNRLQWRKKSP